MTDHKERDHETPFNSRDLLPSEIRFVGSDLGGASIIGDISRVSFPNTKLEGAWVNGKLCDETLSCLEKTSGSL